MIPKNAVTTEDCIAATCPPNKVRLRIFDGGGLYLEADANGAKRWFWKYRLGPKEKRLSIGAFPRVSVERARLERDAARNALKNGLDPVAYKHLPNGEFDRLDAALGSLLEELRKTGGAAICNEIEMAVAEHKVRAKAKGLVQ